jgi:hypothetical protein
MVADAVVVELGCAPLFPANREKNREFNKIAASGALEIRNSVALAGLSVKIPYPTKQGIISLEQGSLAQEQGILSAKIEIVTG